MVVITSIHIEVNGTDTLMINYSDLWQLTTKAHIPLGVFFGRVGGKQRNIFCVGDI